jgi:hypothetical protein
MLLSLFFLLLYSSTRLTVNNAVPHSNFKFCNFQTIRITQANFNLLRCSVTTFNSNNVCFNLTVDCVTKSVTWFVWLSTGTNIDLFCTFAFAEMVRNILGIFWEHSECLSK